MGNMKNYTKLSRKTCKWTTWEI